MQILPQVLHNLLASVDLGHKDSVVEHHTDLVAEDHKGPAAECHKSSAAQDHKYLAAECHKDFAGEERRMDFEDHCHSRLVVGWDLVTYFFSFSYSYEIPIINSF